MLKIATIFLNFGREIRKFRNIHAFFAVDTREGAIAFPRSQHFATIMKRYAPILGQTHIIPRPIM